MKSAETQKKAQVQAEGEPVLQLLNCVLSMASCACCQRGSLSGMVLKDRRDIPYASSTNNKANPSEGETQAGERVQSEKGAKKIG